MTSHTTDAYAGDLSPKEAWELLSKDHRAVLVDVRSQPEWSFVGQPDLSTLGKQPLSVSWQHWTATPRPAMVPNPSFADEVASAVAEREAPIIFLCRSGVRSKSAAVALAARGYRHCFNLAGGFEGPHDSAKHRGAVTGWKAAGLPWIQE